MVGLWNQLPAGFFCLFKIEYRLLLRSFGVYDVWLFGFGSRFWRGVFFNSFFSISVLLFHILLYIGSVISYSFLYRFCYFICRVLSLGFRLGLVEKVKLPG